MKEFCKAQPKGMKNLTMVVVTMRDGNKRTGARKIWGTEGCNSFLLTCNVTEYSEPQTYCSYFISE